METGLSLGSNLGDRLANLRRARRAIAALPGVTVVGLSPVYETEPVGVAAEHSELAFLNAVIILSTELEPGDLLDRLSLIETGMGRKRGRKKNVPREIDIDMIFAGNLLIARKDGGIPHPRWSQRRFVVQPLCDLRPGLVIPGELRTVREVLLALPDKPKVVLFSQQW